jgi:hypothetical protein
MVIFHSYVSLPEGIYLVGGIPTPLKNMLVSWDDDIPNIWKNKSHVPNHQQDSIYIYIHEKYPSHILVKRHLPKLGAVKPRRGSRLLLVGKI